MTDALVETWEIHNRVHLYLLAALGADDLAVAPSGAGRSVADLFAHVHNVRLMWLRSASPDLLEGLEKIESGSKPSRDALVAALTASGDAVARLVAYAIASNGRVKGFRPHVTAFVGYLVSHESHHRGQVTLLLRAAGRPLDKKTSYGLWEWGVR